ncbi:MAG: hypothetical protein IPK07_10195 [Deltaproteobacteria bacterium]|nr:hypothetical protein [Deltaproteobacteria bacterium]
MVEERGGELGAAVGEVGVLEGREAADVVGDLLARLGLVEEHVVEREEELVLEGGADPELEDVGRVDDPRPAEVLGLRQRAEPEEAVVDHEQVVVAAGADRLHQAVVQGVARGGVGSAEGLGEEAVGRDHRAAGVAPRDLLPQRDRQLLVAGVGVELGRPA